MIQANELRVSNWVKFEDRFFQIDVISREEPFLNTIEFGVGVVSYKNIEPIPLTEEILIKCGFDLYSIPFHAIMLKTVLFYYNDNWYFKSTNTIIKYLHQLQNLHFALTGKELEINL